MRQAGLRGGEPRTAGTVGLGPWAEAECGRRARVATAESGASCRRPSAQGAGAASLELWAWGLGRGCGAGSRHRASSPVARRPKLVSTPLGFMFSFPAVRPRCLPEQLWAWRDTHTA